MSYPNQKRITIHKPKYDENYVNDKGPFMQIGIDEWQEAYKNVEGNPSALAMYFYLASNADGYEKYLSSADFKNAVGKSKSSYHRGIDLLKEKGYIYTDVCGSLNFATTPQESCEIVVQNWEEDDAKMKLLSSKSDTEQSQNWNVANSNLNIEIDNKENKERKTKTYKSNSKDYSYLDEIFNYEDGSYMWQGKIKFIDGNEPKFWDMPRDYQEGKIAETSPFKMNDIKHILDKMEEQYYE